MASFTNEPECVKKSFSQAVHLFVLGHLADGDDKSKLEADPAFSTHSRTGTSGRQELLNVSVVKSKLPGKPFAHIRRRTGDKPKIIDRKTER